MSVPANLNLPRSPLTYVIAGVVLVAAFWLLILGPKRNEASELGAKVEDLKQSVAAAEEQAEFAERAREEFPANYQRVIVLGKAVPENGDTSSFLVQLNRIAGEAGADFRGISLAEGGGTSAPTTSTGAAPPASSQPTTTEPPQQPAPASGSESNSQPPPAAPPTEAGASNLAIGATVGPAGLGVLPYTLRFRGDFFAIADFMQGLDRLVSSERNRMVVDGRLTTVDGFSLSGDQAHGFPVLDATVSVTTYLTPSAQGLTGGATPTGPAPSVPGQQPELTSSAGGTG